ncbi:MAG: prepilin-type N-terminal cleavage/methylation domain-containing protein [Candidatus Magasanikbacteria bacterium]|nr:prepilin-type N-terminal cleavage/methylation domain-containing protein [Candidatus Magasanikbacteria bacterium]
MHNRGQNGFSLVEVIVAVAVFVLFALGVYGAINSILVIARESRLKVAVAGVLSQQMEIIRSVPYDSVGTINGLPSGVLSATSTITDGGLVFNVITTVSFTDDAFDGTATSTPADTNPADYKVVTVAVRCAFCVSQQPAVGRTFVAPPVFEGAPETGSLFIHVVDAEGWPVPGASISIRNDFVNPPVAVDAVTDMDGWYTLLSAPTSTLGYNITTTKSGYSLDYTAASSTNNPAPTKLPASVSVGAATTISFAIDLTATLNVKTVDNVCAGVSAVPFALSGQKLIGSLPMVYKFYQDFTTDGGGDKTFSALEWDNYSIMLNSANYDVAGTVPLLPFPLLPGAAQNATVVVAPHSNNSLLVIVKDAVTGLPLADATARLTKSGYDQSLVTGLGFVGQTDWSLGSGQESFANAQKYFSDSGSLNVAGSPGDVVLKSSGNNSFLSSGWLESSTFDAHTSDIAYAHLYITPTAQPHKAGATPLQFQLATSNSSSPAVWNFLGSDGSANTFYTATNTVITSLHNDQRYLRYRAFLSTVDNKYTPILSDFYYTFTSSCTPPGQAFFTNLAAATYTLTVSKTGYQTNSGSLNIVGNGQAVVNLSPS